MEDTLKELFQNRKLTHKNFIFMLIISSIMAVVIVLTMVTIYQIKYNNVVAAHKLEQETAVNITEIFVKDKLDAVASNMKMIKSMEVVDAYIARASIEATEGVGEDKGIEGVADLFIKYASNYNDLTQIRIIDVQGNERIRVDQKDDVVTLVEPSQLQNKSTRYYFKRSMEINENDIYVSDIDLNVENGRIVEPFEPTIRISEKLYKENGDVFGILVLNFDGSEFFKLSGKFAEYSREAKDIGILDTNNYWSMSNFESNLNEDVHITVTETTNNRFDYYFQKNIEEQGPDYGNYSIDGNFYTYKKIDLSKDEFITLDLPQINWYIIGSFDMNLLVDQNQFFLSFVTPITIVLILLGGVVAYILLMLIQVKSNNSLLLMASAYISDSSHDGIVILSENKRVLYCNTVFEEIFMQKRGQAINKRISSIFGSEIDMSELSSTDQIVWQGNVWNETRHGNLICKHLMIKLIKDSRDKVVYYIGIYTNPDESRDLLISDGDDYNGSLMNQSELDKVSDRITSTYAPSNNYAVLTLKITGGMRKILEGNQKIHGQFIALSTSQIGTESVQDIHVLAIPRADLIVFVIDRFEGDKALMTETELQEIIKQIEGIFRKSQFALELDQVDLKFQVGIAYNKKHGEDARKTLKYSMIALEALLKFKKSRYLVYEDIYYEYVKEDLQVRDSLKTAFDDEEFSVVYQPQYALDNEAIKGVEVLVRWYSGQIGFVPPDRFIPLLEESNGILMLGVTVIDLVIKDIKKNPKMFKNLRVSVNLSSREFIDPETIDFIITKRRFFNQHHIKLCIEITETTLVENLEDANKTIMRLHSAGIEIAIDDFGTGYSSLGYLKQLLADELKIDRMFIKDFPDGDDGKIIKAIISMGKEMKMNLVVEGVETYEQLQLIKSLKCDMYQGYYGSKPLAVNDLAVLLESYQANASIS